MFLYLNRYIRPGSTTRDGTIHGSLWWKLQEVLNSEMSIFHIFRLLPSLNKCGPFLLGRYSTTIRRECGQECFSYLLSSMWFPAAVRLSTLFGGHIVSGSLLRIFDSHRVLLSTSLKSLSIQSVATIKCTQGKAFGDWGVVKTGQPVQ